jgi:type VI secretion system protein ImpL
MIAAIALSIVGALALVLAVAFVAAGRAARRAATRREENAEGAASGAGDAAVADEARALARAREQAVRTDTRRLEQRVREALHLLRRADDRSRWFARNRVLHRRPWIVVLAPHDAAWSAARERAGLPMPAGLHRAAGRACGPDGEVAAWRLTEPVVLVEAPARDLEPVVPGSVEDARWRAFLCQLRRARPGRPLDGVVVALPAALFARPHSARRAALAEAVRDRLHDLQQHVGWRCQVHVVVTRSDRLEGFGAFAAASSPEARAAPWGVAFDIGGGDADEEEVDRRGTGDGDAVRAPFAAHLDDWLDGQQSDLLARLAHERDACRRVALFRLPQSMASLRGGLVRFLDAAFLVSPSQEPAMLRGVWFTGAAGADSPSGRGESSFLRGVLCDVVVRGAAASRRTRRAVLARRCRFAAVVVGVVVVAAAWGLHRWRGAAREADAIAQVAEGAAALARDLAATGAVPADRPDEIVPVLAQARRLGATIDASLGARDGAGRLAAALRAARARAAEEAWWPRVAVRASRRAREATSLDERYDALKLERMLQEAPRRDIAAVRGWLRDERRRDADEPVLDPSNGTAASPGSALGLDRIALEREEVDVIASTSPRRAGEEARGIAETRAALRRTRFADRLWERVQRRMARDAGAPFRLSDAAGVDAAAVFSRARGAPLSEGLPGAYAGDGARRLLRHLPALARELADEAPWVLGLSSPIDEAEVASAIDTVKRRHANAAVVAWDALLADVRIGAETDDEDVAGTLRVIARVASTESPLRRLIVGVAHGTTWAMPTGSASASASASAADASEAGPSPGSIVDAHFERLHHLAAPTPTPPGTSALDRGLDALREFGVQLRAADDSARAATPSPGVDAAASRLSELTADWPQPIRHWIDDFVARALSRIGRRSTQALHAAIDGEVGRWCRLALDGRYPLVPDAGPDVPLGDFAALFGPEGHLDHFFQQRLAARVDTSRAPWRLRDAAAGAEQVSGATLESFRRAAAVRDAFFPVSRASPSAAVGPGASADLVLVSLDDGVSEVRVVEDRRVTVLSLAASASASASRRLEAGRAVRLAWPASPAGASIQLVLTPRVPVSGAAPPAPVVVAQAEGPWAAFRLVDAGRASGGGADRLALSYGPPGLRAVFELRADSVRNPWRLDELRRFRCPA